MRKKFNMSMVFWQMGKNWWKLVSPSNGFTLIRTQQCVPRKGSFRQLGVTSLGIFLKVIFGRIRMLQKSLMNAVQAQSRQQEQTKVQKAAARRQPGRLSTNSAMLCPGIQLREDTLKWQGELCEKSWKQEEEKREEEAMRESEGVTSAQC